MNTRTTAITGGIGAGKSVIARIVRTMGYQVYDCDMQARILMESSADIHEALCRDITPKAIDRHGNIDRKLISSIVFSDAAALKRLNAIVHGAVRNDIISRIASTSTGQRFFIETAILFESQIDKIVDDVWLVSAPVDIRINRVMKRSGLTRDEIIARIKAQNATENFHHKKESIIDNSETKAVIPQILNLLQC